MAAIDSILERNGKEATPFATRLAPKLCVVACDDAALTVQLEAALGLRAGEAPLIRLPAGAGSLSEELLQRAVAKAVFVEGCEEVLLLSHSGCSLATLRADQLIEAIGRAGVSRSAIPFDLRELVGAGRDPRQAVADSAQALRRCAFLPATLLVHVGHLDESTGTLQLIEHGGTAKVGRPPSSAKTISGYEAGPAKQLETSIEPTAFAAPGLLLGSPLAVPDGSPVVPSPEPVRQAAQPPAPSPKQRANPALHRAVEAVRAFMASELPKKERQWVRAALSHAAEGGQSADALVKIALQPVLKTGNKRYRVIDDMILVKDEVSRMPPARAFKILRGMVE